MVDQGATSELRHPLFARLYVHVLNRLGSDEHNRRVLLDGLSGRVAEIGCGDGVNFALYPPSVTEVIGIEPEPYFRARAQTAARAAPIPVRVLEGHADALPLEDESVDAVIYSLVLCSVPSQAAALAQARRVLAPGGELRFYEHVAARGRVGLALQRAADQTFWPRAFGNCHTARDTQAAIAQAGFQIQRYRRLRFPNTEPPLPHILGVARRP
jgi:SAM-dependent methyltransferase